MPQENLSLSSVFQGDVKGSLRNLCKDIHRHPSNAALWLALAQLQFELADQDASCIKAAGHTAYAALVHGRSTMDVSKVYYHTNRAFVFCRHLTFLLPKSSTYRKLFIPDNNAQSHPTTNFILRRLCCYRGKFMSVFLFFLQVLSLVTLAELLAGNGSISLIRAQQGVHQSPQVAENWIVLVGALLSKPGQNSAWLRQLITHVRRRLETPSPSLSVWLSKSERIVDSQLAA